MTKDDIIRMAEEAGAYTPERYPEEFRMDDEDLKSFANLVAAAEREACLQAVGDLIRKHRDEKDGDLEGYPDIFDAYEAIRARSLENLNKAVEKNGEEL